MLRRKAAAYKSRRSRCAHYSDGLTMPTVDSRRISQRSAASLRAQAAAEARWGRPKQPKPLAMPLPADHPAPDKLITTVTAPEALGLPAGGKLQSAEHLQELVRHELPTLANNHAFKVLKDETVVNKRKAAKLAREARQLEAISGQALPAKVVTGTSRGCFAAPAFFSLNENKVPMYTATALNGTGAADVAAGEWRQAWSPARSSPCAASLPLPVALALLLSLCVLCVCVCVCCCCCCCCCC